MARLDGDRVRLPVDLDGDDLVEAFARGAGCAGSRSRAPPARRRASSASGSPACRRRASADARRRSATSRTAPCSSTAVTSNVDGRAALVSSGRTSAPVSGVRQHVERVLAADVRHLDRATRAACSPCGSRNSGRRAARQIAAMALPTCASEYAVAQQRAQVVAAVGEQAGVELAVGGQPRARAVAAERLRHRRDDADLVAAVAIAPALRDFAGVIGIDRLERELAVDRSRRSRRPARRGPSASRSCGRRPCIR